MASSKKDWREFLTLLKNASGEGKLELLLEVFLTPAEQEDLTKRYQIIRSLLAMDKTQRVIAKELGLSIAKITRGANALKRTPSRTLSFLSGSLKEQKHEKNSS